MKKIGFVDYYISEWHANNYPAWIDALGCDYKVTHAWAEWIFRSLTAGVRTSGVGASV